MILNPFLNQTPGFILFQNPYWVLSIKTTHYGGGGGLVCILISKHGLSCVPRVVQIYFAFISTPTCPRRPTLSGEEMKCLHSHVQ